MDNNNRNFQSQGHFEPHIQGPTNFPETLTSEQLFIFTGVWDESNDGRIMLQNNNTEQGDMSIVFPDKSRLVFSSDLKLCEAQYKVPNTYWDNQPSIVSHSEEIVEERRSKITEESKMATDLLEKAMKESGILEEFSTTQYPMLVPDSYLLPENNFNCLPNQLTLNDIKEEKITSIFLCDELLKVNPHEGINDTTTEYGQNNEDPICELESSCKLPNFFNMNSTVISEDLNFRFPYIFNSENSTSQIESSHYSLTIPSKVVESVSKKDARIQCDILQQSNPVGKHDAQTQCDMLVLNSKISEEDKELIKIKSSSTDIKNTINLEKILKGEEILQSEVLMDNKNEYIKKLRPRKLISETEKLNNSQKKIKMVKKPKIQVGRNQSRDFKELTKKTCKEIKNNNSLRRTQRVREKKD